MIKLLLLFSLIAICSTSLFSQCPEGLVTSETNLVVNGDFEKGDSYFSTQYISSKHARPGKYAITDNARIFSPHYFTGKGDHFFMAVDGALGQNLKVWEQRVKIKPNTTYFFSAWVLTLNIRTGPPALLQFSINDQLLDHPFICPNNLNTWKQFFVNWTSDKDTTAVIKIVSQNPYQYGNDFGIDRIKLHECLCHKIETKLLKAEIGETIELREIYFDKTKSELKEKSHTQLNQLVDFLKMNTFAEIEIAGHTDNSGDSISNEMLSYKRANAVVHYLTERSIDASRLKPVGYGETKPISTNGTLEGRQKNRRVEFKVIAK